MDAQSLVCIPQLVKVCLNQIQKSFWRSNGDNRPLETLESCIRIRNGLASDGGLIKLLSTSYLAGRHPASAQSSPLTAALVTIKQMASAISSGLISRFNCVCGSTLVRMNSSPSARTIGVSVNPGWITLQRTP